MFQGILRGNKKNKAGEFQIAVLRTSPSRISRVGLDAISSILPQNSLNFTLWSNSCNQSKGVGLCLPQKMYPNRVLCWILPAPIPHLVFFVARPYHLMTLN
jgi:hypothetical protein